MKKTYEKPVMVMEKFDLSQHIAACAKPIKEKNFQVKEGCCAKVPSIGVENLFYGGMGGSHCKVDGSDMYCYTKGSSSSFVFSS